MLRDILRKNKDTRRIFGQKELQIILKQLDGVKLTQSERNRLSRDIRPKLEIVKLLSQFQDEFKLKKDANNFRKIENVVKLMVKDKLNKKIKAILLYGSHVNGIVTTRSDIDMCVLFDNISKSDADKFRIRILGNFSLKMDIQVFNILPAKIKKEIAKNHRVLYKSKSFDNIEFTIRYLKDNDFFFRMETIIGAKT